MPAGRFVIPAELLASDEVELPPEVAHQARDVLRLAQGDTLTLLDGAGQQWSATLVEVGRRRVLARLVAPIPGAPTEPRVRVALYQGVLKAARFEWVLQKGTELGVAAFVPLISERSVAGTEATGQAKRTRWRRLLEEATEQCGRTHVPGLAEPCPLPRALAALPSGALALIPWEGEHTRSLRDAVQVHLRADAAPPDAAHLFVGPEGGFSADEIALATDRGVVPVTLGPRILRAETAALAATVLLLEACGAMG
jgi:16S rRNA (uracil1498-N3)-methyltransferase